MKKNIFVPIFFLFAVFLKAQTFTSSNLPIVIISTDFYPGTTIHQDIPDDPKVLASMKIIYHPDGSRNYMTDQNNPLLLNYNGRIKIEVRGSTSSTLPKKPYSLSTIKADNINNNNVSILGMPKDNDWKLNSFAYEPTFVRDFLAYNMSSNLGQYACRGKHCEVILNDEYIGVYMLTESIKIAADRVDITQMNTLNNSAPDITGGYITKCDKIYGAEVEAWEIPQNRAYQWVKFIHESPKPSDITNAQDQYIHNQFNALQYAATNSNSSVVDGYPSIIDLPSFIDFMLINELMSNVDGYQYSTYFHKDRNGKLRAGPLWDFNLSAGRDEFGSRSTTYDFQFNNGDNVGADFWYDLFYNPTFNCYFVKRWQEVTAANQPLSYSKITHTIDSLATLLAEAKVREEAKWGTIGSPDNSISDLKTWINDRIAWLNSNLSISGCTFPTVNPLVISKIHYNPLPSGLYTSNQLEFIELTNNSNSSIDVSGYYFRELGLNYIFPNNSTIPANGKIYLASNSAAFSAFYNYTPFGEYSRNLSNSSEKLVLTDAYGNIVDYVHYQDASPWPAAANGVGSYLKLKGLNLDNSLASSWIASTTDAVSSAELQVNNANTIFPNPSSNQINISNNELISSYEIYDEVGRLLLSENNIQSRFVVINLQSLAANTYIVKTTLVNQHVTYDKVIKF